MLIKVFIIMFIVMILMFIIKKVKENQHIYIRKNFSIRFYKIL